MKRVLLIALLLGWFAQAEAGQNWFDMWHNADQQGDVLLQHGDARGAAARYSDPQRRAYAEFQAGDYAAAARDFSGLSGNEARYNQGNALAFQGDLQGALKAYDAVLKSDPNHKDAKHNRDLVAAALNQQKQQQRKDQNNQSDKEQSGNDQHNPQQNNQSNQQQAAQNGKQDGKQDSGNSQQNQSKDGNDKPGSAQQKDDARQARADAGSAFNKNSAKDSKGTPVGSAPVPQSEQQMAQQQWLRAIPDDPGGLLRRKFMIEHMIRQQQEQQ